VRFGKTAADPAPSLQAPERAGRWGPHLLHVRADRARRWKVGRGAAKDGRAAKGNAATIAVKETVMKPAARSLVLDLAGQDSAAPVDLDSDRAWAGLDSARRASADLDSVPLVAVQAVPPQIRRAASAMMMTTTDGSAGATTMTTTDVSAGATTTTRSKAQPL
jgi:hypothetical protein